MPQNLQQSSCVCMSAASLLVQPGPHACFAVCKLSALSACVVACVCVRPLSPGLQSSFVCLCLQANKSDIIFFCSPNNPTGAAATREQLTHLVETAKKTGSLIVYDAAYALYIEDENCPKSIFEIPGMHPIACDAAYALYIKDDNCPKSIFQISGRQLQQYRSKLEFCRKPTMGPT